MGGRPLEGPTMVGRRLDWNDELGRWLKPFVERLGHRARRRMCPLYVSGLIGPGDRKSVQPMAKRLVLGEYDQLHHFIAASFIDVGTATRRQIKGWMPSSSTRSLATLLSVDDAICHFAGLPL